TRDAAARGGRGARGPPGAGRADDPHGILLLWRDCSIYARHPVPFAQPNDDHHHVCRAVIGLSRGRQRMADREHEELLQRGVAAWNAWRNEHPTIRPNLAGCKLVRASLARVNLRGALLFRVDLSRAALEEADL